MCHKLWRSVSVSECYLTSHQHQKVLFLAVCLQLARPHRVATVVNMATSRAPKQWCLTKKETITSFESWKQLVLQALLPDVESTLQQIGQWRYLVATDLSSAFHQIPLSKDSLKFCGVATPFTGFPLSRLVTVPRQSRAFDLSSVPIKLSQKLSPIVRSHCLHLMT